MPRSISTEQETHVVALLARGDTYAQIKEQTGVYDDTIAAVKKRNKDNLEIIKQQMMVKATEDALSIKDKANKLISQKLDRVATIEELLDKARSDWVNDIITYKEFEEITRKYKSLTVNELISISREMNVQTTKEPPPAKQADMAALIAAIRSGDEVSVTKAVFNAPQP